MTPLNFVLIFSVGALIFGESRGAGFILSLLLFYQLVVGVPASIVGIAGALVSRHRLLAGV